MHFVRLKIRKVKLLMLWFLYYLTTLTETIQVQEFSFTWAPLSLKSRSKLNFALFIKMPVGKRDQKCKIQGQGKAMLRHLNKDGTRLHIRKESLSSAIKLGCYSRRNETCLHCMHLYRPTLVSGPRY